MKTNKFNYLEFAKKAAVPLAGLLLIGSSTFTFLSMQTVVYSFKTTPSQYLEGEKLSALKEDELQQKLEEILDQANQKAIPFRYEDEIFHIKNSDLNLEYSFGDIYAQIEKYETQPRTRDLILDILKIKKHKLVLETKGIDIDIEPIKASFTQIYDAQNAHFETSDTGIQIKSAESGFEVDPDILHSNLNAYFNRQAKTVELVVKESAPTVVSQDLEIHKETFEDFIKKPINFTSKGKSVSLYLDKSPEKIEFNKNLSGLTLALNQDYLAEFVSEQLDPSMSKEAETVEITYENNRASFSTTGAPGYKIDEENLVTVLNEAITTAFFEGKNVSVDVPLIELEPNFVIPEELQARGIKELIAVGYTTYHGSPANRIHNISVGVKQFNGVILPREENFSFNNTLGEVDETTGYLPELVIKGAETIPEFGGGLCQVSTTFYRAALFAGLEIVDRAPHSYAVSYYSQVLGHGLDATIYPPFRDLVVKNNTSGDILMQSYTVGAEAYFRFFGTDPQLEVELEGPIVSNHRAVGEPETEVDESLAPGTQKQVAEAHAGFDTLWYRIVKDKDGNITKEPINSRYRAVPAKILVGPEEPQI